MLFNSIDFAIFLPLVFLLYWGVLKGRTKQQNLLIVLASYVFYGWWDWRFLSLILFSTILDYSIGLKLKKESKDRKRKLYLWISILVNLGFLGFFKYYNFFLDNFISAFSFMGVEFKASSLNIILPVGISFYTFQTLSYTIDVYKRKLEPTQDFVSFMAFVSFFPQLVAGPIERASHLLPQFYKERVFDYQKAVDGMRQILWGLFKKVVIADTCAQYANEIFNNYTEYSGITLILGALFFTFQIYGDFSGYSDIAIGTSRLFGFDLMKNFAFPYFSRDVAEFWRRWHISLSTWFRDYLYIPLGGSRGTTFQVVRNTFIIFLVSGFWHGANWTFVFWGGLNAIYFLPLLLRKKNRHHLDNVAEGRILPSFKEFFQMLLTFSLAVFAWIFFRAESLDHAFLYLKRIALGGLFEIPHVKHEEILIFPKMAISLIVIFVIFEWLGRRDEFALEKLFLRWSKPARWIVYILIGMMVLLFSGTKEDFIYFQF